MPALGDIARGRDVDKKSNGRFIWTACPNCGTQRWVRMGKEQPVSSYCVSCRQLGEQIPATCSICGKVKLMLPSDFGSAKRHYCSSDCLHAAQRERVGRDAAHWKGGKVERVCELCGKTFVVLPSTIKRQKGRFCSLRCHAIYKRQHNNKLRPNKTEVALSALLEQLHLPFKFVGCGEVWLGNRNPDYINTNGKKQVIELFGAYWHPIFDVAARIEHYRSYGFACLVVWDEELKNAIKLRKKLRLFAKQPHQITDVSQVQEIVG